MLYCTLESRKLNTATQLYHSSHINFHLSFPLLFHLSLFCTYFFFPPLFSLFLYSACCLSSHHSIHHFSVIHHFTPSIFPFFPSFCLIYIHPIPSPSSIHTSISSVSLSFSPIHSSVLYSHPPLQLLGLQRCRRPRPGSAPDRDGRHRATPRRHCAGRHQPARHDR